MLSRLFRRRSEGHPYLHITTIEKAREAAQQGILEATFLTPLVCGGEEVALNVVYLPPAVKLTKDQADDAVIAAAQAGKVAHYECLPAYEADSIIPVSLRVIGLDEDRESVLSYEIPVWDADA